MRDCIWALRSAIVLAVSSSIAWRGREPAKNKKAPDTAHRYDFGNPTIIPEKDQLKWGEPQDFRVSLENGS
jgi:hypothetical protein